MKLRKSIVCASMFLFVVISLMSGGAFATVIPLVNGNFASPDIAGSSTTAPDGWEAISWAGNGFLQDHSIYPSADNQGIKVYNGATAVVLLGQTTAEVITAGMTYTGSYYHSTYMGGVASSSLYLMADDGNGTLTPIIDTGALATPTYTWLEGSISFAADDYSAMIGQFLRVEMKGETTGSYVFLDDVNLSVVPEPATMILLGLGGLLGYRRRRKS